MMKPRIALAALLALLLAVVPAAYGADRSNLVDTALVPDSSFIYETSIFDLQNSDTYYEGQTVQVTGEAVGDIVDAGDGGNKWITVDALPDEQAASVQVYVSAEQVASVNMLGRYQRTGATVSVTGKYHLACGQHDGLSDIHATSLTVLEPGANHHRNFALGPFVPALALVFAGLAFFWLYRRKREELR